MLLDLWESYLEAGMSVLRARPRHEHDHGHHHPRPASEVELRARALEALLVEKGLVSTDAIDAVVELYEHDVGPQNGAKVVARAWVDPAYRERLLDDGTAAIAELGFGGAEGDTMVVVENTPSVHNVDRLHALLLLPVAGARAAAHLVQEPAVPRAGGRRAARRAARVRPRAATTTSRSASGTRAPRCATSCCRATRGHRGLERGGAGRRWSRRDAMIGTACRVAAGARERERDRRWPQLDAALAGAAPLPRDNGELVFEEPWQGRALGLGVVVLERTGAPVARVPRHLAAAIGGTSPGA